MTKIDSQDHVVSNGYIKKLLSTIQPTYVTPDYTSLVYNSWQTIDGFHLLTIASAVAKIPATDQGHVLPGSSFTIEVYSDNTIKAFYLDKEVTLNGCKPNASCNVSDFLDTLNQTIVSGFDY